MTSSTAANELVELSLRNDEIRLTLAVVFWVMILLPSYAYAFSYTLETGMALTFSGFAFVSSTETLFSSTKEKSNGFFSVGEKRKLLLSVAVKVVIAVLLN